ncbi:ATP-NAD kinase [Alginatibacterium sediminis]|uniref:ATP-NAD kinase n=1 Tax=Alginatibacterium sediminis TaxID=2164068 RepID=A0A420EFZ8_9ALTE|nr:ATP-NAD kinase family protein [Alginatibacterium sediminis]RKF19590.1 ATP-NAD kinase [Alginatibacterium sediminis]
MYKIGLIINPIAGIGGSVALKGSDDVAILAQQLGGVSAAKQRSRLCFEVLLEQGLSVEIITASGDMGGDLCTELGWEHQVVYDAHDPSSFLDTQAALKKIQAQQVDIVVFAGGDGTARDISAVLNEGQACLGIPAGCKIHSAVYGVSPRAAGHVLAKLVRGEMLSIAEAQVMDIDETAFRQGVVKAKRFGEMWVPQDLRYVQSVKMGGVEHEALVIEDLAAHIQELLEPGVSYIIGSGSTIDGIMQHLNLENTLLGVDLLKDGQIVGKDLTAQQLLDKISLENTHLLVTPIGGQGHLFGRGNQQLSATLLRKLSREQIWIVASKQKMKALQGRWLVCDTGDPDLDLQLSGSWNIITGYHDQIRYRVSNPEFEVSDARKLLSESPSNISASPNQPNS